MQPFHQSVSGRFMGWALGPVVYEVQDITIAYGHMLLES